eukprot:TRINITY_DN2520_c8_g1_i1.p1 TRINITY_DN2520_c8_g1~~TRINITY_DN2520_c8_g1_i1.p1  ORF type:complete len:230 (+),score=42.28 TRINITY_DN2520_c8_g1_i1:710-1399(+)
MEGILHDAGGVVRCQVIEGGVGVGTLLVPSEEVFVTRGVGRVEEFGLNRPVCSSLLRGRCCAWGEKCIFVHVKGINRHVGCVGSVDVEASETLSPPCARTGEGGRKEECDTACAREEKEEERRAHEGHTLAKGQVVAAYARTMLGSTAPGTHLYRSEEVLVTAGVRNGKGQLCKWYQQAKHCRYNEKCRFIHVTRTATPLAHIDGPVSTARPTVTYGHLLSLSPGLPVP